MRLIDADLMLKELKDMEVVIAQQNIADWIDEQPTAHTVEVVRCKDCVYFDKFDGFGLCSMINDRDGWFENNFCSYGERRDGD